MSYEFRLVNQLTFESEKNQKISPDRVSSLAKYILRHLAPPDRDYYAFDCQVQIQEVDRQARIARVLMKEIVDVNVSKVAQIDLRYNNRGFFLTNADKYREDDEQSEAVIESGYLLGSVEPFDLDFARYIAQLTEQRDLEHSRRLVGL